MITLRNLGELCARGIKCQIPLHTDRLLYVSMFTLRKIRIVGVCFEIFEENFAKQGFVLRFSLSETSCG
jgi:hypothetical protein